MLRSKFRVIFTLAFALALMFQVFFGIGTGMVYAASSQPTTADGYHPVASVPTGVNYCYPSGYNRQGWRCGWRLAMAPYNLGSYNCGYYGGYYGNCGYNGYYNNGYYNNGYYNSGYGGRTNGYIADYGGQPRYNPCYYQQSTCYNPCYNYGSYCYGGYR
jgi:hypothetical protein